MTRTAKPAWPAPREIARGAYAANRTESGSATQSATSEPPISSRTSEPITMPIRVPPSAWPIEPRVPSALLRRIDRVPSTTQKAFWTESRSAAATARAIPIAPRMLF